MATRSFVLPNGSQIDLTQDLSTIFTGMVSRQTLFTPTEGGLAPTDPCAKQIELKATVSSFELKNTQLGVSFGYTPSGAIVPNLKLTGSVDFNIGSLTMDFSVWECTGVGAARKCTVIAASAADHRLAQITFAIRVDFDQIGGGTSLVYNTRVRDAIDAIMVKGLEGLMASPRIDDLGWKAVVREWHPDSGTVVFNSGQRDGVKANQAFTVYAATSANSSCDVYKAVAHVKTSQVDLLASSAVISSVLDARGIQVGDWVYVRPGAP